MSLKASYYNTNYVDNTNFFKISIKPKRSIRHVDKFIIRADVSPQKYDAVIVGGGISGLCTAQSLITDHSDKIKNILVTEGKGRVGGNIISQSNDRGYIWEEGPNSFQPNDAILKISMDVGLIDDLVLGDPEAPRFVYWENKLRKTPSGPDALTFDLLSVWGKLRAGLGAIGLKNPAPVGIEETVEQFIKRNLGIEVFDRLIEPFCSGVYAGDAAKLSMKAAFGKIQALEEKGGSLIGGTIKLMQERKANPPEPRDPNLPPKPKGQTVGSYRKGLQMLPDAISNNLGNIIKCNWSLQEIYKKSDNTYDLEYKTPEGQITINTKCLALTMPAYVTAEIIRRECPGAFEALVSLDYPPVASVTLAYPFSAIRPECLDNNGEFIGFGQLHPRTQGIETLGTIYSSSLFPNRAPDGMVLLTNYIGGATNRSILDESEDELVNRVDRDLRKMLIKNDSEKPLKIGVKVWPKAIPQFNIGHLETVRMARTALDEIGWNGVKLGGNYVCGVALGKCIDYASEFANEISEYLIKDAPEALTGYKMQNLKDDIIFT